MLNEERIRIMTNLARFEDGTGKETKKICQHYQVDYVGLGLFKNMILTMVGYLFLWAAAIAWNLDYVMSNLHKLNFPMVIFEFVMGYLIILVFYSAITYARRSARYQKAKKELKRYQEELDKLAGCYAESGGNRK
jgi:hypothetical protein